MTYGSAVEFQGALTRIGARYQSKARAIDGLPTLRDLRVSLNVAAADMRPLVVLRADKPAERSRLIAAVAKLVWKEERVGRFHFVVLESEATFEGLAPGQGLTVVQPDPYGLGGAVLARHELGATEPQLATTLDDGLEAFEASTREHDDHVREARRRGIRWETAIPVTDSHGPRRRGREGPRGDGPRRRRDR